MAIWETEVIRVDGNLFAYVRVQNEYNGNISGSFRRIYQDKNGDYYAKADGSNQNLTNQVNRFLASEIRQKEITDFIISIIIRSEVIDEENAT